MRELGIGGFCFGLPWQLFAGGGRVEVLAGRRVRHPLVQARLGAVAIWYFVVISAEVHIVLSIVQTIRAGLGGRAFC